MPGLGIKGAKQSALNSGWWDRAEQFVLAASDTGDVAVASIAQGRDIFIDVTAKQALVSPRQLTVQSGCTVAAVDAFLQNVPHALSS